MERQISTTDDAVILAPRLLLVEDNPVHARLVFGMLAETWVDAGEKVAHVKTFDEALQVVTTTPPDCVLLDLVLPDAEGLESVYEIRKAAPMVPVVVMSAHDDETLAVRAVDEGAQDYLVKGKVDAHGLRRSIIYAIERARRQERPDPPVLVSEEDDAEALGVGLVFFDLEGTIGHADRTACRLFDRGPDELVSSKEALLHPDDDAQLRNALTAVHAFGQGPAELPLRIALHGGVERRVMARCSLVFGADGSPSGFIVQLARVEEFRGAALPVDESLGTVYDQTWEIVT